MMRYCVDRFCIDCAHYRPRRKGGMCAYHDAPADVAIRILEGHCPHYIRVR